MKQIAIIGPTASGKTSLAIDIAKQTNSIILSLDSLCVYKYIDIASAKPTKQEQDGIIHFGIDEIEPYEDFDVIKFLDCYNKTLEYAKKYQKNIIIVGGTGFYLKILLEGISTNINYSDETIQWANKQLQNKTQAYNLLKKIDPIYMEKIDINDTYRLSKALQIYKQTNQAPSEYFIQNPKIPIIKDLKIFEIIWDPNQLRQRINLRTQQMIKQGVIDEVIMLEKKYTREPNCMSSIGIKETLQYLDGKINKQELQEQISIHTAQLAKRQRTFNKNQFNNIQIKNLLNDLKKDILKVF
jgi:tRNA dimethylallyltransferase